MTTMLTRSCRSFIELYNTFIATFDTVVFDIKFLFFTFEYLQFFFLLIIWSLRFFHLTHFWCIVLLAPILFILLIFLCFFRRNFYLWFCFLCCCVYISFHCAYTLRNCWVFPAASIVISSTGDQVASCIASGWKAI